MKQLKIIAFMLCGLLLAGAAHAKDGRNLSAAPVQLNLPGERPINLYANSYALVIGASNYTNGWPKLPGVLDDVKAVSKALAGYGFNVTPVTDPTSQQLDAAIKKFIANYGQIQENRLLIYYAGHGHTLQTSDGRQLGYIVPVDAPVPGTDNVGAFKSSALSMEFIESYAKQIDSKHALFVFDSCFSGTFFKMRAVPEIISLKSTQPVRQFITAGSADQPVPDESIFRRQFLAGIAGEADLNKDGYVTGSELGAFLEDKVTNYSKRTQTPQYGKIQNPNLDKGDFIFALAGAQVASLVPVPAPAQPAARVKTREQIEDEYWEEIKDSGDLASFEQYNKAYPDGRYLNTANLKIAQLKKKVQETERQRQQAEAAEAAARQRKREEEAAQQAKQEREAAARQEAERQKQEEERKRKQAEAPKGYVSQGGLTWMPVTFQKNWADANSYCTNTAINGQTGWRLPTMDELMSLDKSGAAKGQGWSLGNTWSSTPYGSGGHYLVFLSFGDVDWNYDTHYSYVTCVH